MAVRIPLFSVASSSMPVRESSFLYGNGRMEEWKNRGMEEWRNGGMDE
jgi:hypothetical protein